MCGEFEYNGLLWHCQVTNTGKEVLCELCVSGVPVNKLQPAAAQERSVHSTSARELASSPTRATAHQHNQNGVGSRSIEPEGPYDPNGCAGCNEVLKEGQALIALDRQWHISCFR